MFTLETDLSARLKSLRNNAGQDRTPAVGRQRTSPFSSPRETSSAARTASHSIFEEAEEDLKSLQKDVPDFSDLPAPKLDKAELNDLVTQAKTAAMKASALSQDKLRDGKGAGEGSSNVDHAPSDDELGDDDASEADEADTLIAELLDELALEKSDGQASSDGEEQVSKLEIAKSKGSISADPTKPEHSSKASSVPSNPSPAAPDPANSDFMANVLARMAALNTFAAKAPRSMDLTPLPDLPSAPTTISESPDLNLPSAPTTITDSLGLPAAPTTITDSLGLPSAPTTTLSKSASKPTSKKIPEVETWCCICTDDAAVICYGCLPTEEGSKDGELYCARCWKEVHLGPEVPKGAEERGHAWEKWRPPT